MIQLCECPRDAMQGINTFIPTEVKVHYMNLLLQVGFHRLDFGSFVSPKAIPQLRDTRDVVEKLDLNTTQTQLLAIIANERGAREAAVFEGISVLGFPFSLSETFQQRNTNASRAQALNRIKAIAEVCFASGKIPLVYLSMGFGNPYGDPWDPDIALYYTQKLQEAGIREIMIADTTGVSSVDKIRALFPQLQAACPEITFGLHLHSEAGSSYAKVKAALEAGCHKFDSALRGFGGCPMAEDELVGNIATETILQVLEDTHQPYPYNQKAWQEALLYSTQVFTQ